MKTKILLSIYFLFYYSLIAYDGILTAEDDKGSWCEGLDSQELYVQDHFLCEGWENIYTIYSQWNWGNGVAIPSQEYCEKFYNRTINMINQFHPDLIYATNKPEIVEYYTAKSPTGQWIYHGLIQDSFPNSITTHPGIIDYCGSSYYFYHNGVFPTEGGYRRSVCIDYFSYNVDCTIQKVVQTRLGVNLVK